MRSRAEPAARPEPTPRSIDLWPEWVQSIVLPVERRLHYCDHLGLEISLPRPRPPRDPRLAELRLLPCAEVESVLVVEHGLLRATLGAVAAFIHQERGQHQLER
jgi:hypothetical protein